VCDEKPHPAFKDLPSALELAWTVDHEDKRMGLLRDQIAAVTGAGSGIGRAIASGFAREGARVILLDIDSKAVADAAEEIRIAGYQAEYHALDVSRRDDCFNIAAEIGDLSVLVNSAGINRRNPITADPSLVLQEWQLIMSINIEGMFNITHAFLPALRRAKGKIINIGSVQSFLHVRTPNSPAYTTSKHAVLGFTKALAAELGKDGVRVNAIGPGLTETPLNAQVRATRPDVVQQFIDHTPLGRSATPEDMIGPAVFLASNLSAYVTGGMIMVDGGYLTI
jgi:NAD(P)-dependent dehydrogenase (short-subunit alcohol dehydrogenase family)